MASPDKLIRTVAEHRQQIGAARPYPPAGDCVLFAITEAAELIDALLRQESRYLRNNARQISPADEAGDLGYMIASAIDQIDRRVDMPLSSAAVLTGQILDRLVYGLISIDRGDPRHGRRELLGALETWQELCRREGYGDPDNVIAETCQRITAKWAPPPPRYPVLSAEDLAAGQGTIHQSPANTAASSANNAGTDIATWHAWNETHGDLTTPAE